MRREYALPSIVKCLAFVIPLASPLLGQSLPPTFERLPIAIACCFLHDSNGFLWIGSQEGLARYDGYNLKFYTHTPFDSTSLSNDWVSAIAEDKKGNLWVGTHGGALNYFNQRTEKFTRFLQETNNSKAVSCKNISSIVVNNDGTLWIGTRERGLLLVSFDINGNAACKTYDFGMAEDTGLKVMGNAVWSLLKDREGKLWIGTSNNGLICLDTETDETTHYRHKPQNPASLCANSVSSLCEDDSGNIWIGTGHMLSNTEGNGLSKFDRRTQKFIAFRHDPSDSNSISSNSPSNLLIDHTNTLWIGTIDNGLFSVQLDHLYNSSTPPFSKHNNVGGGIITSLYEDRLGNIWVGVLDMYMSKYDRQQSPFLWYRRIPGNPNSLGSSGIECIYVDKEDRIWFGHHFGGMTKFDPGTGKYTHYKHDLNNADGISSNWINAICEDDDGMLWLGTSDNGIDVFNPSDESFIHMKADPNNTFGLRSNKISFLLKTTTGDIWVSTWNEGLQLFDQENKRFTTFDVDSSTSDDEITTILYEDSHGTLWIGTSNNGLYGVTVEDRHITKVRHYVHNPTDRNSLSNNGITDIIQSKAHDRSALWIATDAGLNRLDLREETFTHYFRKDGLPHDLVLKVLEDSEGNVWASTAYELCVYNVKTGKFSSYGKDDGLPVTGFGGARQNSAVTRDRQLLFGSANGALGFYPEKVMSNPNIPHVRLTDFKILHKSALLDTSITFKSLIHLSHNQSTFSFEFTDLNFSSSKRNQFAYILEGLYDDWVYIGKERTSTFTDIDPGRYIFRVKVSNDHGILDKEEASLVIVISPPWWKSTWAYLAYIIIIGTSLYSIYCVRMNRVRLAHQLQLEHLEATKMHEVDRMKSRFFANISHEFRTPLTLILGPIRTWREKAHEEKEAKDLGMAERNTHRLLRLINQLLDLSKLEAGAIKLRTSRMNIVPLVKGVAYSFESSAGIRGVELNVDVEEEDIQVYCDKDMVEKILINLLSNAFKFTPEGGMVTVDLTPSFRHPSPSGRGDGGEGVVEISVSDTGIGIPADELDRVFDRFYQVDASQTREHEGSGIGLALVKELVELHHGTIRVQSEMGRKTTFTVQLPLGRSHLKDDEIIEATPEVSSLRIPLERDEVRLGKQDETSTEDRAISHMDQTASSLESAPRNDNVSIILIVEDNADVRAYIKDYLVPDYQVTEARDGAEGIQKALEIIPDLIISDVMMPKKDGYEMCKALKCDEKTSHIPIILLTAKAASENKIEGLEIGADEYLVKPFEPKELLARVKNLIELRRTLRERFSTSVPLKPGEIAVTSADDAFLRRVKAIVEDKMADEKFTVEELAAESCMSRIQLHRKLTALTNLSASEFIRYMRLHRAMDLLKRNAGTVAEVAYSVGYGDPSHFSRKFHKQFGLTPGDVRKTTNSRDTSS